MIAGPTASGKTALAVELAKELNGEVINADSRSIYIGMDLGTGKPIKEEMNGIKHHLFDIVSPEQQFTLADYKELARTAIGEIQAKGNIPFIVGGTGLYIDSVVYDYNLTQASSDIKLRAELEKMTNDELVGKLEELDPISANKIDKNNRRRVIRALEVVMLTNKSFIKQQEHQPLPPNVLYLAIDVDREKLYEKINRRVEDWMRLGFEEEVKKLLKTYPLALPAMSGIGYKQIGMYLEGKISKEEAIEKFKQGDRNLAKRQLTWFRKNKDVHWIKNKQEAIQRISSFLGND